MLDSLVVVRQQGISENSTTTYGSVIVAVNMSRYCRPLNHSVSDVRLDVCVP